MQSSLFQDDIFPPTKEDAAVSTIQEWLSGVNRLPNKVSLKGNMQSGLFNRGGATAAAPAPVAAAVQSKPQFGIASVKSSVVSSSSPKTQSPAPVRATFTPAVSAAPAAPAPPSGEVALLKAWYAQQKEIDELKKKIAQLEGR